MGGMRTIRPKAGPISKIELYIMIGVSDSPRDKDCRLRDLWWQWMQSRLDV